MEPPLTPPATRARRSTVETRIAVEHGHLFVLSVVICQLSVVRCELSSATRRRGYGRPSTRTIYKSAKKVAPLFNFFFDHAQSGLP